MSEIIVLRRQCARKLCRPRFYHVLHFLAMLCDWLRHPRVRASRQIIGYRHNLCSICPARRRGWFRWFCGRCGCTISLRRWPFNKLAHLDERCPLHYWR